MAAGSYIRPEPSMLRTTVNIHIADWVQLSWASAYLRMTIRKAVMMLLVRLMPAGSDLHGGFTTVAYQDDDPGDMWHCFTIRFYPDEMEFWSCFRRFSKKSLSKLIHFAIAEHLGNLMKDPSPTRHNYVRYVEQSVLKNGESGAILWFFSAAKITEKDPSQGTRTSHPGENRSIGPSSIKKSLRYPCSFP